MKIFKIIAVFLVLSVLSINNAMATTIKNIRVNGLVNTKEKTVLSYLKLVKGTEYNNRKVNKSIKNLLSSGLYAQVKISIKNSTVYVNVDEVPMINKIAIEGNKNVNDEEVKKSHELKPGDYYDTEEVIDIKRKITNIYKQKGYYRVKVDVQMIKLPRNRINLIFKIIENTRLHIDEIHFIGNNAYTDFYLKRNINTQEYHWWAFLTSTDVYNKEMLDYDKVMIENFYRSRGFAKARVKSVSATMNDKQDGFVVTYIIDEGKKFTIGKNNLIVKGYPYITKEHKSVIMEEFINHELNNGVDYDKDKIEVINKEITDYMGNLGYTFAEVDVKQTYNDKKQTVDFTYTIKKGSKQYVRFININGNNVTKESIVRRDLELYENAPFSRANVKTSKSRLGRLNYFEKVDVDVNKTDIPEYYDVDIDLKEKKTGSVSIGFAFSTEGPSANFGYNESNAWGSGKKVSFKVSKGSTTKDIDLSITEPYFMNRFWSVSTGASYNTRKRRKDDNSMSNFDYDNNSRGVWIGTGFYVANNVYERFRYSIDQTSISNVNSFSSPYIVELTKKRTSSAITHTISYDTRDRIAATREGSNASLTTEFSGIGGNVKYISNIVSLSHYIPLNNAKTFILESKVRASMIKSMGDYKLNMENRNYLGGNSLRGYGSRSIAPYDVTNGEYIGGEKTLNGTFQLWAPLTPFKETSVYARAFFDYGVAKGIKNKLPGSVVFDNGKMRYSAGIGLTWLSPFGAIHINYARAMKKYAYDEKDPLTLDFGVSM